jgi:hypothetical protein
MGIVFIRDCVRGKGVGKTVRPAVRQALAQRPLRQSVNCECCADVLWPSAQSEGDTAALALLDEFEHAVVAYINSSGGFTLKSNLA